MQIIKRTGAVEEFNIQKIYNAVDKAFTEVFGEHISEDLKEKYSDYFKNNYEPDHVFNIEEVQNIAEEGLMREGYYSVARAFIKYREKHKQNRIINERVEYMDRYGKSKDNAATSSETDANANVSVKNVANLNGEVYKTLNREIQRYRMRKKLKEIYPQFEQTYIQDLESHVIYAHDEASTPVIENYTYSPKEVVLIKRNGHLELLSLESVYKYQNQPEIKQQKDGVWCKFPQDLEIYDKDGKWTKILRLTRKTRYNDMVRVKTSFGEDLVVTANHPLIVEDDRTKTVPAENAEGLRQFREKTGITFEGIDEVDLTTCVKYCNAYPNFITTHEDIQHPYFFAKRFVKMNRDMGYIVGFFIGDGNYDNNTKCLDFSQSDTETLDKLSSAIFDCFGVGSYKCNTNKNGTRILKVCSSAMFEFFIDYLKIKDKAQNKCLPYNLLWFNEEFAKGIIEGIIDSDGTTNGEGSMIDIRLSSRECIGQLTMLLRYFGFGVSNTTQNLPFGNNNKIKTNYTIWGVGFSNTKGLIKFDGSEKWRKKINKECDKGLKYSEGWSKITSVTKIGEGSFLDSCENIYDITTESNSFVCNNLWVHNCQAVSLYPFVQHGSSGMDGLGTTPPHNMSSFAGQFSNLVFLLSAQCKGAVAFGEFFLVFDHYCTLDFGSDYNRRVDEVACLYPKRTIGQMIDQYFQQIIYTINQPAGNRCYQSPFTNVSYYDENYYHALFDELTFPDGSKPEWERVSFLQKRFMKWLNNERTKTLLTFPVETMALLTDGKDIIDKDYKEFTAEMYAEGHSFFTYISDNPNALASCCRLRNEIKDNVFSFTNGLTGVQTGSANVITLNLNRIIQDWAKENEFSREYLSKHFFDHESSFSEYLVAILERVYAYQIAFKSLLYETEEQGMLTASNAGYISMSKLYSTIGENGLNEAAEFVGLKCSYNEGYKRFCRLITGTISSQNKIHSTKKFLFNQEFVPAEGLSSKNYNWDKADGYWVPEDRVLYNSYFYLADDPETSVLDKFRLHGREFTELLDGGVGLHCNLEEHLSKEQYLKLIDFAIKNGTSYFTFNIPNSECTNPECHHIVKKPIERCPICGSRMRYWTRIIGYLRPTDNFDYYRYLESLKRFYAPKSQVKTSISE